MLATLASVPRRTMAGPHRNSPAPVSRSKTLHSLTAPSVARAALRSHPLVLEAAPFAATRNALSWRHVWHHRAAQRALRRLGAAATDAPPALAQDPGPTAATLRLVCREFRTNPGQQLAVVGNAPELGSWSAQDALRMTWQPGHAWAVDVALAPNTKLEFKLVLIEGSACSWEPGANRKYQVPAAPKKGSSSVELIYDWGLPRVEEGVHASSSPGELVQCVVAVPSAPVRDGQRLVLTGNVPELGTWKPEAAVRLAKGSDGMWRGSVQLPIGQLIQTKLVVVDGGGKAISWEGGENRALRLARSGSAAAAKAKAKAKAEDNGAPPALPGQYLIMAHFGLPFNSQVIYQTLPPDSAQLAPVPSDVTTLCNFVVPCRPTIPGQHLLLVGSIPELGEWNPTGGLHMTWQPGHAWIGSVELPPDAESEFEIKVVFCDNGRLDWEPGSNRRVNLTGLLEAFKSGAGAVTVDTTVAPAQPNGVHAPDANGVHPPDASTSGEALLPPRASKLNGAAALNGAVAANDNGNGHSSSNGNGNGNGKHDPEPQYELTALHSYIPCYWGSSDTAAVVIPQYDGVPVPLPVPADEPVVVTESTSAAPPPLPAPVVVKVVRVVSRTPAAKRAKPRSRARKETAVEEALVAPSVPEPPLAPTVVQEVSVWDDKGLVRFLAYLVTNQMIPTPGITSAPASAVASIAPAELAPQPEAIPLPPPAVPAPPAASSPTPSNPAAVAFAGVLAVGKWVSGGRRASDATTSPPPATDLAARGPAAQDDKDGAELTRMAQTALGVLQSQVEELQTQNEMLMTRLKGRGEQVPTVAAPGTPEALAAAASSAAVKEQQALKKQLADLLAAQAELQESMQEERQAREAEVAELTEARDAALAEVASLRARVEEVWAEAAAVQAELEVRVREEVQELRQAHAQQMASLVEEAAFREALEHDARAAGAMVHAGALADAKAHAAEALARAEALEAQLAAAEARSAELSARLADAEGSGSEGTSLADTRARNVDLAGHLAEARARANQLTAQLTEAKALEAELPAVQGRVAELSTQLAAAEERVALLQAALQAKETTVSQLTAQLDAARAQLDAARSADPVRTAAATAGPDTVGAATLADLERTVTRLSSQLADEQAARAALLVGDDGRPDGPRMQLDVALQRSASLREALDTKESAMESLRARFDGLASEFDVVHAKWVAAEGRAEDAEAARAAAEEARQVATAAVLAMEHRAAEAAAAAAAQTQQLATVQAGLVQAEARLADLQAQLAESQEEGDELAKALAELKTAQESRDAAQGRAQYYEDGLKAALHITQREVHSAEEQRIAATNDLQDMNNRWEEVMAAAAASQAAATAAAQERDALHDELAAALARLKAAEAEAAHAEAERQRMAAALIASKEHADAVSGALTQLEERAVATTADLQGRLRTLEDEAVTSLLDEAQTATVRALAAELQDSQSQGQARIRDCEAALGALRQELQAALAARGASVPTATANTPKEKSLPDLAAQESAQKVAALLAQVEALQQEVERVRTEEGSRYKAEAARLTRAFEARLDAQRCLLLAARDQDVAQAVERAKQEVGAILRDREAQVAALQARVSDLEDALDGIKASMSTGLGMLLPPAPRNPAPPPSPAVAEQEAPAKRQGGLLGGFLGGLFGGGQAKEAEEVKEKEAEGGGDGGAPPRTGLQNSIVPAGATRATKGAAGTEPSAAAVYTWLGGLAGSKALDGGVLTGGGSDNDGGNGGVATSRKQDELPPRTQDVPSTPPSP